MQITRKSPVSGKEITRELDITPEQLQAWKERRGLIQNLMPQLSANDREFLKTGITPEEWDTLFKEDKEEDDSDPYRNEKD